MAAGCAGPRAAISLDAEESPLPAASYFAFKGAVVTMLFGLLPFEPLLRLPAFAESAALLSLGLVSWMRRVVS